jgi:hypothetical protein
MKAIVPFLALLLISFITLSQENLKDLSAYEDVNVKIEVDFNPSVILVLEEKEFDKLLLGEKLSAFLEMNDFKIASLQAGKAAENAYLLRYNYEYIVD